MSILEVNNLKKTYVSRFGGNKVEALKNVNFTVEEGEYVAVMGESGSGKTTLLNILASLDKPTGGNVILDGKDMSSVKESDAAAFRRDNLGFVFQEFNLLDTFSVEDNVFLPLVLAGKSYGEMYMKLDGIARRLGISDILKKYPYEISGGQKQRAAVARAIITDPKIILADEPTGALDSKATDELLKLFSDLNAGGQTVLMVTHSVSAASRTGRILFIRDGEVFHQIYKGVVPEIASRKHIEKINQVIEEALKEAEVTLDDIDAIGVTYGPGLVGALLVGVAEAKAIAYAAGKPLVGVHHIEGHIAANFIEHKELEPPFFSLVVSGGHTHLVRVKDYGKFDIIGRTRDDAAGEAFDKVARAIGLGYPGGPKIDKVAKEGNPDAIAFPRANVEDAPYDFSFSGLKSAVLNYINGCKMKGEEYNQADIAASFQKAVTDVLVAKAMHAVEEYKVDKFAIAGGVASNSALRAAMKEACEKRGVKFYYPSPIFCTDNAAMIGVAAYYEYMNGTRSGWDLNAVPNLKLGER